MTEELDILKVIAENPLVSQRKIAQQTGISLGQVNFLIRKCAKKGLVKVEGQTTKSIKYNLTPKGFSEIAALTLNYIKISYNAVIALTNKIEEIAQQYKNEGYEIYVSGMQDEMMELVKLALGEVKSITAATDYNKIVLLYWDEQFIQDMDGIDRIRHINILQ